MVVERWNNFVPKWQMVSQRYASGRRLMWHYKPDKKDFEHTELLNEIIAHARDIVAIHVYIGIGRGFNISPGEVIEYNPSCTWTFSPVGVLSDYDMWTNIIRLEQQP